MVVASGEGMPVLYPICSAYSNICFRNSVPTPGELFNALDTEARDTPSASAISAYGMFSFIHESPPLDIVHIKLILI